MTDARKTCEPRHEKTCFWGFRLGAAQTQKMARGFEFRIKEEEGLFYLCSGKCADQLRRYCTADLCLCFCICKNRFSYHAAHIEDKISR